MRSAGASAARPVDGAEGQQRVGALVEVPDLLRGFGANPAEVIASAGIDPAVLRNAENALTFPQVGRLFRACVAATGCAHFGLLVGQRSATTSLGVVGRLMRNAPTVREAILDLCVNQQRYVRGSVVYLMVREEVAIWGYAVHHPAMPAVEQLCDGAVAVGRNMLRELIGASPEEVWLCRRAPADVTVYRRFFGVAPRFDAEHNALAFPASLLARPVAGADGRLRSILEESVRQYWAVQQPSIADHVVRMLRAHVVSSKPRLTDAARRLAMTPRTLNRRLASEGVSYRGLLAQGRIEAAQQMLLATRMQTTDVALALGYSDLSSFTRAFTRGCGTAPSAWRAGQRI